MPVEHLFFSNTEGEQLSARLDMPDGPVNACALFAHCFTCSKNLRAVNHISRALTTRGVGVFRFDFTGLGESEGDFADTNFSTNTADLVAAAAFMAGRGMPAEMLIGHSLGGAAVLQAAAQIPSARAVATIGAPGDPEHVAHLLQSSRAQIEAEGVAEVVLAGRSFMIRKQFLDDLAEHNMQRVIRDLKRALIVLHSPIDNTVGIENAAHIFKAARHPKSFISLDDADHLLTNGADARYVGQLLAAWVTRYLD
jgi:putative redox protein